MDFEQLIAILKTVSVERTKITRQLLCKQHKTKGRTLKDGRKDEMMKSDK